MRKPVSERADRMPSPWSARPLLLASLSLLLAGCGSGDANAQADWDTMTASRSHAGEDVLRVSVEYGAGTLRLASAPAGALYRADLRYDRSMFAPRIDYEDGRLQVALRGNGPVRGRNIRGGELDLLLSPAVPLELDLQFGAADASLDLGGLTIRSFRLQTGASRTSVTVSTPNPERARLAEIEVGAARLEATGLGNLNAERLSVRGGVGDIILDFTGDWQGDMAAQVEMGLGSLTLRVPQGLGVRVNRSGALSSFDGQGLTRRDNSYLSENFEAAPHKLVVSMEAALGRVRVVWVD
jgi:hypothetical protein